jgi:hypothetical protein
MAKVSFSGENLGLDEIANHHNDITDALSLFFSSASPAFLSRFAGWSNPEVHAELERRKAELDLNSTMNLLASIEAAFRVDYLQRCYQKKKDSLSYNFRDIYKEKGSRASLEDDILGAWKVHRPDCAQIVGALRGAFKFRHWMAHGRYWKPKLGQNYDFTSVYELSLATFSNFDFLELT